MYTHKISYSHEPRYQTFGKDYGFLSFHKNMAKNIGKKWVKMLLINRVKNFLIMLNNLLQILLRLHKKNSKRQMQK